MYDDRLIHLIEMAAPREILAFEASDDAKRRAHDLMERNNAGKLSPDENAELQQVLYVERLVAMLKARAKAAVSNS